MVRGIRGAITVKDNDGDEIISATGNLIKEMVASNRVVIEDIASVFFSLTPDLNQAFPAEATRTLGWKNVPLFCSTEIDVPHGLKRCIRILILTNTDLKQNEVKHIYIGEAKQLREDLTDND